MQFKSIYRWTNRFATTDVLMCGQLVIIATSLIFLFINDSHVPLLTFYLQGNAAAAQLGALNMNPAYRNLAPQQLTAAQQQQLLLQQGLNPSQLNSPQFQQLLRAGLIGGQVFLKFLFYNSFGQFRGF